MYSEWASGRSLDAFPFQGSFKVNDTFGSRLGSFSASYGVLGVLFSARMTNMSWLSFSMRHGIMRLKWFWVRLGKVSERNVVASSRFFGLSSTGFICTTELHGNIQH